MANIEFTATHTVNKYINIFDMTAFSTYDSIVSCWKKMLSKYHKMCSNWNDKFVQFDVCVTNSKNRWKFSHDISRATRAPQVSELNVYELNRTRVSEYMDFSQSFVIWANVFQARFGISNWIRFALIDRDLSRVINNAVHDWSYVHSGKSVIALVEKRQNVTTSEWFGKYCCDIPLFRLPWGDQHNYLRYLL